MIRKLLWITWLLALSVTLYAQKTFELKTGDILFQTNKAQTSFVKAIENVTTSADDLNFSHVGVVVIEEGEIFVLEATMPVVCKTPLEKYLKQAKLVNGKPLVVVGRLKPRFRKSIPKAIEIMKSLLGKPYDFCRITMIIIVVRLSIWHFSGVTESLFSRHLPCLSRTREPGKPVRCG